MAKAHAREAGIAQMKERDYTFAALHIPNAHGLVEGAADDEVGLRVEGAVEHV
jgi:hypothetical protein